MFEIYVTFAKVDHYKDLTFRFCCYPNVSLTGNCFVSLMLTFHRLSILRSLVCLVPCQIIFDSLHFPNSLALLSVVPSMFFLLTTIYLNNFTLLPFLASCMCRSPFMETIPHVLFLLFPLSIMYLKKRSRIFLRSQSGRTIVRLTSFPDKVSTSYSKFLK